MPGQGRLHVVQVTGQYRLDQLGADRRFSGLIGGFEGLGQMPFDLQGCPQPAGQKVDGLGADDPIGTLRMFRAGRQRPMDVLALAAGDAVEGEGVGPKEPRKNNLNTLYYLHADRGLIL